MYDKVVSLGSRLHYPITITKLVKSPGDTITKQENIIEYKFSWRRKVGDDTWVDETAYTEFYSPAEGTLKEWRIHEGQVIASDFPCMTVEETCSHEVQIQGMCGLCGADMTETNWASEQRDSERAMINMTHDQTGLMVSETVAQEAERDTQKRLLRQRKLSLVVDLDQTIIHACIEPIVGEWRRNPSSPNHSAVKDVKSFQLDDERPRGRASSHTYYIKLRPGLEGFLEQIAKMYELHVYTMGTRAYALNIAKIVDPGRKLFGNRIISRDESGSITSKSLHRLFPVSTNMVVIIDDRADVWPMHRANLIQVLPYDFFNGIGDINSRFIPNRQDILPAPAKFNGATANAAADSSIKKSSCMDNLDRIGRDAGLEDPAAAQEKSLEKQLTDRPLLHTHEEPGEKVVQEAEHGDAVMPPQHHNVLSDDDKGLIALQDNLTDIYTSFYDIYDRRREERKQSEPTYPPSHNKARRMYSVDDGVNLSMLPDVGDILDDIKSSVLSGLVIVLSGIVPLRVPVEESEIGLQAQSSGAQILNVVSTRVTHLVVSLSTLRTSKVRQAAKIPSIKIVNQNWLADCLGQWRRLDERPYYLTILDADREVSNDRTEPASEAEDADTEAKVLKDFDWDMADKALQDFVDDDKEGDSEANEGNDGDESQPGRMSVADNVSDASGSSRKKGVKRKAAEAKVDKGESGMDGSVADESMVAKKQRLSLIRGKLDLRSVHVSNDNDHAAAESGDRAEQNGEEGDADDADDELDIDEEDLERDLCAELEAAELEAADE